ncbi:MAG TPA: HTH domain-containing protein [Kiritimatiellia bacterium]|nr:HTH domain-containing protein [Kiritimatiellia bacterium]HMO51050.1 HTH domain-containing protein [Kiritimatiellia bacterium]HMO98911.1 HTH domain-containing protein [Kiritimatiellia bacterium]HMP35360.1 HTH domain-containing protein [Kiritimatiellia bacterium]
MSYSFLDLAYDVLKQATQPMIYQEIWKVGQDRGLTAKLETSGKTPWQSLGARLYVEVRDNDDGLFIKVGSRPTRFFLKERAAELPADAISKLEKEEGRKAEKKTEYHERDLHPLLTYYANSNPSFNRGRSIYTKTIMHEKSTKGGYNEWIHPDMVGFYLPLDDWRPNVIEFNRLSDNNSLRLFSFEIKKGLNKANYRESYFQAVSNSSWAHEGYLVAVDILQDDEFLAELERLASSFGIGIIQLDPTDIDASRILYPARGRAQLDWETINKLCEQNRDFDRFLQDVKIDYESKRIHRNEFDDVPKDIAKYIKEKLKIDQEPGPYG